MGLGPARSVITTKRSRGSRRAPGGPGGSRAADGAVRVDGFEVLAAADAGGELEIMIETTGGLVGCPSCGAVATPKDRRPTWVADLPIAGRPVVLCAILRIWCCPYQRCDKKTWTPDPPGDPAAGGAHRPGRRGRGRGGRARGDGGRASPRVRGRLGNDQPAGPGPRQAGHRRPCPPRGRDRDRGRRTPLATRPRGTADPVRYRHRGPDPGPARAAARPGRRPLRAGAACLAPGPSRGLKQQIPTAALDPFRG
jgi:hypothetical protein